MKCDREACNAYCRDCPLVAALWWREHNCFEEIKSKYGLSIRERLLCRSKQGWGRGISKENKTGVQNPQYRITRREHLGICPVLWHELRVCWVFWTTYTHTQLQVVGGCGRSKSKIELVVPPIFLPFSLLLLFHRASPASGGISAGPRLGGSACQCRLHE